MQNLFSNPLCSMALLIPLPPHLQGHGLHRRGGLTRRARKRCPDGFSAGRPQQAHGLIAEPRTGRRSWPSSFPTCLFSFVPVCFLSQIRTQVLEGAPPFARCLQVHTVLCLPISVHPRYCI